MAARIFSISSFDVILMTRLLDAREFECMCVCVVGRECVMCVLVDKPGVRLLCLKGEAHGGGRRPQLMDNLDRAEMDSADAPILFSAAAIYTCVGERKSVYVFGTARSRPSISSHTKSQSNVCALLHGLFCLGKYCVQRFQRAYTIDCRGHQTAEGKNSHCY